MRLWVAACVALVLSCLLFGCSSTSELLVQNETGVPVLVHTAIRMPPGHFSDEAVLSLDPNQIGGGGRWYGEPPISVIIEVESEEVRFREEIRPKDYPSAMRRRSSAGVPIHVHITKTGVFLTNPTFWEANQITFLFLGWCCCAPATLVAAILFLVRLAKRARAKQHPAS